VNKNTGFTLIEVLIAMLVLGVGLLGLAGLQASSLRNTQSAYNRSLATEVAYDLADRMRANITEARNYGTSAYITINTSSATYQASCYSASGCGGNIMANNDLYQSSLAVTSNLPSGVVGITVVAPIFTITVTWDDNHDGVVNVLDPNFTTSFQL
jgi:type IV pilus assembly protein PilV